ncbi:MAG: hypothetical protein JOZ07_00495 [Solirubrobacterales bacterium]|nr:hypothetical protein [Solirubrobacterales bacterium]
MGDAADVDVVHAVMLGAIFGWQFLLDLTPHEAIGERIGAVCAGALQTAAAATSAGGR